MRNILLSLFLIFITLPVYAKNTILILGDSLSAGYGIQTDQGWAELLKKRLSELRLDYDVVNASVSGDTTSNGLARLPKALEQYHPKITIIALGANDGLRGINPQQIKLNLVKLVTMAKTTGSKVLILGLRLPPNFGPTYTQKFQQLFIDVAHDEKVSVVPLFLKNIDDQEHLLQSDRLHPNAAAQIVILDNVWLELSKIL